HLGWQLRGARRADRQHSLAVRRPGIHHRRADSPRGHRLLLHVRSLRRGRATPREERAARDVGAERSQRGARVAFPRRQVLGTRRGRQARLHLGSEQAVRPHSRAALEDAAEAEGEGGEGETRSASASKSATPMPVKGHARYELWNTRLRKSKANIETENPIAPAQRVPARRCAKTSRAGSGSQSTGAGDTNG